jgi:hypothetical protein
MKNRFLILFAFFAAFTLTSPALAEAPEPETKVEAKADTKVEDTKAAETGDEKAEEKSDAKADEKADEKGDEKADTKEVETDEEAVEAAQGLYTALANRDWALAIAFGLMLLVFVLRKVKVLSKVPAKAIPWVTAVLATVGYVAAALMTPGVAIGSAVMEGAAAGAAAVGLWEMVLKHFLGGKSEAKSEEKSEEKSEGGSGG